MSNPDTHVGGIFYRTRDDNYVRLDVSISAEQFGELTDREWYAVKTLLTYCASNIANARAEPIKKLARKTAAGAPASNPRSTGATVWPTGSVKC